MRNRNIIVQYRNYNILIPAGNSHEAHCRKTTVSHNYTPAMNQTSLRFCLDNTILPLSIQQVCLSKECRPRSDTAE